VITSELQAWIDWFAFEGKDAEDAFMDAPGRLKLK
jgi:hypothetical protein